MAARCHEKVPFIDTFNFVFFELTSVHEHENALLIGLFSLPLRSVSYRFTRLSGHLLMTLLAAILDA